MSEVPWAKITRSFMEVMPGILPDDIMTHMTIQQIEALSAKNGKVSAAEACEIVNERRAKKGLEPIAYLPGD